ncbi:MAG: tail fiber domain-containing protein [Saprospiraceae bacterium]|nr:tail fiber domain-containing protein [Saprospiraceae bacterium]
MRTMMRLFFFTFLFSFQTFAQSGLNVSQGNSVDQDGYLTIGQENSDHIAISNLDIQAKLNNIHKTLYLNYYGADVAIGGDNSALSETQLRILGTTDASLIGDGLMVLGPTSSSNIVIDQNEIIARNNGATSTLYINRVGGDVEFFGTGAGSFIVHDLPSGDHNNLQYNASSGQFYYDNSSRRYKENITTLEDDWTKILNTRAVTYTRPEDPCRWEYGYIAEEIDSIGLTTMVGYDAEGQPEDVRYDKMVIYMVEMLKIQQREIEIQRQEFANQQKEIDNLRAEMIKRTSKAKRKKKNRAEDFSNS